MMRYETKIRMLSALLGFFLLLWALGEFFAPERRLGRAESGSLLVGKAKLENLASIELRSATTTIRLEKRVDSWVLPEADAALPVQARRVEALLDAVKEVRSLRPVASTAESLAGLGLEGPEARRAILRDQAGAVLADFTLGARGPQGREVYLRRGEESAAYAVETDLASYLGASRASWLDRRLLRGPVEAKDVQSLAISADIALDRDKPPLRFSYRLDRQGEGWQAGGQELESLSVEALVRAAINLEAEDLAARAPEGAYSIPAARIELLLGSGEKRIIEVGLPTPTLGRFWTRLSGSNPVLNYEVSAYALRNLLKPLADLAKKP